jgi:hypothetical protein
MPVTHLGNVDLPNEHHDARFFASQAYAASPANRGGYLFQPALSTPEHAVWYNAYKKDVHVAFRGTVPTNSKDLVSDAMLMARAEGSNARFADAVSTLESLARKYSDTSLSVSGHSLGGQLATHVLHHASDATAVCISKVATFNKASTPLPTGFQFKEARASDQANIKQAGDVVSEAAEPNDSHTVVLNNYAGGGLAAHKLESFARTDKTSVSEGRQSVEKNLTKELPTRPKSHQLRACALLSSLISLPAMPSFPRLSIPPSIKPTTAPPPPPLKAPLDLCAHIRVAAGGPTGNAGGGGERGVRLVPFRLVSCTVVCCSEL